MFTGHPEVKDIAILGDGGTVSLRHTPGGKLTRQMSAVFTYALPDLVLANCRFFVNFLPLSIYLIMDRQRMDDSNAQAIAQAKLPCVFCSFLGAFLHNVDIVGNCLLAGCMGRRLLFCVSSKSMEHKHVKHHNDHQTNAHQFMNTLCH